LSVVAALTVGTGSGAKRRYCLVLISKIKQETILVGLHTCTPIRTRACTHTRTHICAQTYAQKYIFICTHLHGSTGFEPGFSESRVRSSLHWHCQDM